MPHENSPTIQLRDICQALAVEYRHARYVLEKGFVPKKVAKSPQSGHHRQFTAPQAFWLGLVLKLKEAGVKTPVAARTADYAVQALRTVSQNLAYDSQFSLDRGQLVTPHQHFLDVAEFKYVRYGTDSEPSRQGQLMHFDWHALKAPGKPLPGLRPCIALRLDLSEIGRRLAPAFGRIEME